MSVFVHLLRGTFSFLYKLASTPKAFQRTSAPLNVVEMQYSKADYFTNYKVRLMRKTRLQQMVWVLPMLFLAFAARGQDLSTQLYTSATTTTVGGQLTFKISVRNDAHLAVTGVQVTSAIPTGTTWVSDDGATAYNHTTGIWTIGAIGAAVDSVVLNVTVQVVTEGVIFSQAEVSAMVEPDGDSTPNNGSVTEDDWSSACATVPIHYNCRDDINALASAPTGYTSYQWYRNGVAISGADKDTYRIREIGDFNFTASTPTSNCPASLCCPITILRDSCLSLGNLVFEDKDNNGTFNGADVGLDNIEVQLYSVGLDGLKNTADDRLDSTMTTANGGLYLFNNLNPGLYYVKLTGSGIPSGMVSSTGDGVHDVDGAGIYEPSTSIDVNNVDKGTQMGTMVMSNIITLTVYGEPTNDGDTSSLTNLTVDFGLYTPQPITPDTLFTTIPINTTTTPLCPTANDIGTIVSSTVTTCEPDGATDFGTYTTNAQGCAIYAAGSNGGASVDTLCVVAVDADGNRDTTVWIVSILPRASIGNLVWNDANNDGIHQNTEGGIPNVDVVLYKFDYTTSTYVVVGTKTTDGSGKYLFNGLDSGTYYVKLPVVPTGMSSSTGNGPTDVSGSGTYEPSTTTADNADHGSKMGTMIVTVPFVVVVGQVDTTRDFGLYVPQSIACDCPTSQDLVPPVLVGVPSNVTLNCQNALPNGNMITATDNCSSNVTVTFADVRANGTCANNYVITRTRSEERRVGKEC